MATPRWTVAPCRADLRQLHPLVHLPRTVDPERISATYREGVLEIEVPKKEEAKPKQIRIAVQS